MLDKTIHKVGADPKLYEVGHNLTANDVTEQIMKGNIAVIKHTDDGETKIETPEKGAEFEVYLKSSASDKGNGAGAEGYALDVLKALFFKGFQR